MIRVVSVQMGQHGAAAGRIKVRVADAAYSTIDWIRLHVGRVLTRAQRRLRQISEEASPSDTEAELEYHRRMAVVESNQLSPAASQRLAEMRRERDREVVNA